MLHLHRRKMRTYCKNFNFTVKNCNAIENKLILKLNAMHLMYV